MEITKLVIQLVRIKSDHLASFPGHRRNGLANSMSSNCYFRWQKVASTNQVSERCQMTKVK